MNVLSLPDEMLVSVLKYNSFKTLTKFRKLCSRVDSVSRKYHLDIWKMDKIEIVYNIRGEATIYLGPERDEHIPPVRTNYGGLLNILKYYFTKKLRGIQSLHLEISPEDENRPLTKKVGQFLLETCSKNIKNLSIVGWDIPKDIMKNIIAHLKPKGLFIDAILSGFNDKMIEGLSPGSLMLFSRGQSARISLPCLKRLCDRNIPYELSCDIDNSTVSDLCDFFNCWPKDMMERITYWNIGTSSGMMSLQEFKTKLSQLKCFEDCIILHNTADDLTTFHIVLENNKLASHRQKEIVIIASGFETE